MGGPFGCSDTSFTVAGGFVRKGHFSQVPADHIELDFDVVKGLAAVDCHVVADHLGHDDGVSEVGFDGGGFFSWQGVLLGFLALGVQSDIFVFDF